MQFYASCRMLFSNILMKEYLFNNLCRPKLYICICKIISILYRISYLLPQYFTTRQKCCFSRMAILTHLLLPFFHHC